VEADAGKAEGNIAARDTPIVKVRDGGAIAVVMTQEGNQVEFVAMKDDGGFNIAKSSPALAPPVRQVTFFVRPSKMTSESVHFQERVAAQRQIVSREKRLIRSAVKPP
jgi:hypothetical protein